MPERAGWPDETVALPVITSDVTAPLPVVARSTAARPTAARPVVGPPAAERERGFRPDVEGLRAIAIGLVLLYHAGVSFLPGGYVGVDVFFVISGFLITTQLASEVEGTGRLSLAGFYARRAKRILPAASLVLVTTAVLVWLFLPRVRWHVFGGDILSAALYVVNWRLAQRSVDYLAQGIEPSPVQHFWSLAVEEQYYLVWPLLVLLAAALARRLRVRSREILWVALALVAVPSLVWSVVATASSPAAAFFSSLTRMWELALGAAIALAAARLARLPARVGAAVGWVGLAAIVVAAVVFTSASPFPGYLAALPTLGAAAVIAGGFAQPAGGPGRVLGTAPLGWVGKLSYSLYLWHWPLLTVAAARWGPLSVGPALAVVAVAFLPAWLSFRLVENPLRRSPALRRSPRLALSLGANFTLVGVVAGVLVLVAASGSRVGTDPAAPDVQALPSAEASGAPQFVVPTSIDAVVPDPLDAANDLPDLYARKCVQVATGSAVLSCTDGDPAAGTRIDVVGDSKMAQYQTALEALAAHNDWLVTYYLKSSCSLSTAVLPDSDGKPYDTCTTWNAQVAQRLLDDHPDYVIVSGATEQAIPQPGGPTDPVAALVAGLRESWTAVTATGATVIVLADNPAPPTEEYECVDEHLDDLAQCSFDPDRRQTDSGAVAQLQAAQGLSGVAVVDLWPEICPVSPCPSVIGNVLLYRQGSHLTATFVATLTPWLAAGLTTAGLPTQV